MDKFILMINYMHYECVLCGEYVVVLIFHAYLINVKLTCVFYYECVIHECKR